MDRKDISIVYMGTPEFAVAPLKALLLAGYSVKAVVTVEDKPAGRGQKLQMSAVKEFAIEQNLPVLQPSKLKDPSFIQQLQELNADLFVVVAFRMLPEVVWSMPRLGTLNLHGSLLPKYRGAAPINYAVINGEKETGVTTFFIKHEIDTGEVLLQHKLEIGPDETAGELHDRLMTIGADLVVQTVDGILKHTIQPIPQDLILIQPSHAPKIFKQDCKIDCSRNPVELFNLIRGLSPFPAAFLEFLKKDGTVGSLKVFKCTISPGEPIPGTILTDGRSFLKIGVNGGFLSLLDVQLAGKKRMKIEEFLRGFPALEIATIL